jgi:hypothetical protein
MDIPSPTRDDLKQRIRLRRFLLASAFSALYLVVLAMFYAGRIDRQTLLEAYAIWRLIIAFYSSFTASICMFPCEPDGLAVLASVRVAHRLPRSRRGSSSPRSFSSR